VPAAVASHSMPADGPTPLTDDEKPVVARPLDPGHANAGAVARLTVATIPAAAAVIAEPRSVPPRTYAPCTTAADSPDAPWADSGHDRVRTTTCCVCPPPTVTGALMTDTGVWCGVAGNTTQSPAGTSGPNAIGKLSPPPGSAGANAPRRVSFGPAMIAARSATLRRLTSSIPSKSSLRRFVIVNVNARSSPGCPIITAPPGAVSIDNSGSAGLPGAGSTTATFWSATCSRMLPSLNVARAATTRSHSRAGPAGTGTLIEIVVYPSTSVKGPNIVGPDEGPGVQFRFAVIVTVGFPPGQFAPDWMRSMKWTVLTDTLPAWPESTLPFGTALAKT
jgi:hypothetical protein